MARAYRLDSCDAGEMSDGILLIAMNYHVSSHTVFLEYMFYFFNPLNTKINLSYF